MSDLISRQAALKAIEELISVRREWWSVDSARDEIKGLDAAICEIQDLPTSERVGKWIKHKDGYYRCSECGSRGSAIKAHYCHHCGSRNYGMIGDGDE